MSKNKINLDEIQDQHLDTMIKLAFEYEDALEAEENTEADENMPVIDAARKDAVWNITMEKIAKMEAEEKKKSRIVQFRRSIPRIIEVAACLILVMGIAAPFAIANVEAIRVKVMELLISIHEDHTELQFVEDEDAEFYVPAEWQGSYYPMNIPEGFVLEDISMLSNEVTLTNEVGDHIYFGEYTEDDSIDINSENASLSYATVNGSSTFVIEREDCVILTWSTEDRFFVIFADTAVEEALNMAQSVRRISFEK